MNKNSNTILIFMYYNIVRKESYMKKLVGFLTVLCVALIAVVIVVAREFVISGFRLVASDNGVVIAASMWGKFKTATTMVAICLMIVVNELSEFAPFIKELTMILFWVAITLTVVSLVDYVVKNWTVMFASDKEVKPVTENKTEEAPKFDPNTGEPLK